MPTFSFHGGLALIAGFVQSEETLMKDEIKIIQKKNLIFYQKGKPRISSISNKPSTGNEELQMSTDVLVLAYVCHHVKEYETKP